MTQPLVLRLALLALLVGPLVTHAEKPKERRFIDQGSTDKRLAGYETPEGLKLEVAIDHPVVADPVALVFGNDGTPYALEQRGAASDAWEEVKASRGYKDGTTRAYRAWKQKTKAVVKALVASKPGGPWDGSRVVLELDQPSGLLLHDGWFYLMSQGTVRRYKPSKAGGKFDESQLVAQGFGTSAKESTSGLAIGPDGWLYVSSPADDHHVEGSDGSRATVYRSGAVFRCRPDGSKLHTYASGFRSASRQLGFSLAGHAFAADGVRLIQVSEGSDFGYRLAAGSQTVADAKRSTLTAEIAGRLPAMHTRKDGLFAGAMVYNDTKLPEAFRGLLIAVDTQSRVVRAFGLEQTGATFGVGENFDLVRAAKDPAFQPRQTLVGPDGAVYIVTNRILRIRGADAELRGMKSLAKVIEESDENLLRSLSDIDATVRATTQAEFIRRGDRNRKALIALLVKDKEEPILGKLAVVGVLQTMFDADVQTAFLGILNNADDELRRAVAEALGLTAKRADADAHDSLLRALIAEDNDLRRAVALAMARVAGPGTGDNLATTLSADDGKDRVLHDGLVRALEMLGKSGIDALINVTDSGVQKDTDRVATTFLGLRVKAALDAVPRLLKNPHLSTAQRTAIVDATMHYSFDGPVSLEAVATAVGADAKESDEVRLALLHSLVACSAANGPKTTAFVVAQLSNNNLDVRMSALVTASELRVTASSAVLVKALAGELSPEERLATVRTLRQAGVKEKAVWEAVHRQLREESTELKRESLRTLAVVHPETALSEAGAYLLDKDVKLQREAVIVSGLSATGAKRVGQLWQDGKLPRTLRAAVITTLTTWAKTDAECAKILEAIAKTSAKE